MATEDLLIRIAERGASQTASQLDKVGKAGQAVGAAIAAGAAVAGYGIKKAMDFESVMAEVKAVTGASKADMASLSAAALDLGAKSGLGAIAAGEGIAELAKAGMDAKTIIGGGLNASVMLAKAGTMQLGDAAAATANVMGLFGMKADQAGHIADALATAALATTADVKDFTMALAQGGAAARAAGLDFDQTMVALEALARAGIKNSDAGTSLKAMLNTMVSPQSKKAMAGLGIAAFDSAGKFKDLATLSGELREKLGGLTNEQRLAAATAVAGADGQKTLLALYNAGPKTLREYAAGLSQSGTAAQVAAEKDRTLAGALRRIRTTLEAMQIRSLTPFLNDVGESLNKLMDDAQSGTGSGAALVQSLRSMARFGGRLATTFSESVRPVLADSWGVVRKLVSQFQRGKGAGGALRDGIKVAGDAALIAAGSIDDVWNAVKKTGEFINTWSPVIVGFAVTLAVINAPAIAGAISMGAYSLAIWAFTAAATAGSIAGGALAAVGAVLASPFLLVAAVIAGVVAALAVLWFKSEGFRNWVKGAWQDISSWIGQAAKDIGNWFSGIPGTLKGVFTSIIAFFVRGMNQVIGVMRTAIGIYNKIPMAPDIPLIDYIAEPGSGNFANTVGTDSSHRGEPQLAQGGTVRGVGSWITGEAGAERNTKRPDGSVVVEPLTSGAGQRMGGPSLTIVARDGATKMLLESLIERIEFDGARAG